MRVAGGKTLTSQRAPFAGLSGVFGDPAMHKPVFSDPAMHMPVIDPIDPPMQVPGNVGPSFMRRPLTAARREIYGPPYGLRPGPLARQDTGIGKHYLRDYPNHPWAGLGEEIVPDALTVETVEAAVEKIERKKAEDEAGGVIATAIILTFGGLFLLDRWSRSLGA
jgi:hypothetical protein